MPSASCKGEGQRLQFQRHEKWEGFYPFLLIVKLQKHRPLPSKSHGGWGAGSSCTTAPMGWLQIELVPLGLDMGERVPGLSETTRQCGTGVGDHVQGQRPLGVVLVFWGIVGRPRGWDRPWGFKKFWPGKKESSFPETEAFSFSSNVSIKASMGFWVGSEGSAGSPGHSKNPCVLPSHRGSGWPTTPSTTLQPEEREMHWLTAWQFPAHHKTKFLLQIMSRTNYSITVNNFSPLLFIV